MKKKIYLKMAGAVLIGWFIIGLSPHRHAACQVKTVNTEIEVYSSPEYYEMALGWIESYQSADNSINVKVLHSKDYASRPGKAGSLQLKLASDQSEWEIAPGKQWKMVIGRDPVIPVVSNKNPKMNEILESGISSSKFSSILTGTSTGIFSGIYILNNPEILGILADYCGIEINSLSGQRFDDPGNLGRIFSNNPGAVALVRLSDILSEDKSSLTDGISLVPFDINGNNKIDSFENIYGSTKTLQRGLWIGKYPGELVNHLYLCADAAPAENEEINLISHLVINGDELLAGTGFAASVPEEKQSSLSKLRKIDGPAGGEPVGPNNWPIIILLSIIVLILVLPPFLIRQKSFSSQGRAKNKAFGNAVLNLETLNNPKGILFDKSHTWTFMEEEGKVKLGIDDFLQHVLGPISDVDFLNPGDKVKKGQKIITLSNQGKKITVKSPVSGIITDINPSVDKDPQLVNIEPYTEGWLYKIEPFNWQFDNSAMLMAESYLEWIKKEMSRLKDFLSNLVSQGHLQAAPLVLTDGGEIPDNTLSNLDAEAWEDFQVQFIDNQQN